MVTGDHKGIINLFKINSDGSIGEKTHSFVLPGEKGPLNEKIQPWSRPHHVPFSPDGQFVMIADKGLDIVHSYHLDRQQGILNPVQTLKCHGASCPRHLWFHPSQKWAYINTEYTSTIIACYYNADQGTLTPFQVVPALPDDYFDVKNMTSEMVVDNSGKFLYISNRGHESIGAFSIDQETGRLTSIEWVPCGGKKPRYFAIEPSGRYLLCGNQSSDLITVFEINEMTGQLMNTGKTLNTPTPVWMLFTDGLTSIQSMETFEGGLEDK